jgi:hypothetical protein
MKETVALPLTAWMDTTMLDADAPKEPGNDDPTSTEVHLEVEPVRELVTLETAHPSLEPLVPSTRHRE